MKSFRLRTIPLWIAELSTILLLSTVAPSFGTAQAQWPGAIPPTSPPRHGVQVKPAVDWGSTAQCPGQQHLTGFELRTGVQFDTIEPICVAAAAIAPLSASDTVSSADIDVQSAGMVRVTASWYRNQTGQVVRVACPPTKPFVVALNANLKNMASYKPHQLTISCDLTAQEPADDHTSNSSIQDIMSKLNQHEALGGAYIYFPSVCPPGELATGVRHWYSKATGRISVLDLTCSPQNHVQLPEAGASEVADLRSPARVAQQATERQVWPADITILGPIVGTRIGGDVGLNPRVPVAGAAPVDPCDAARRARERSSPATAGLEAQCAAYTARVQPARTEQEIADMAARGAAIGLDDPAIMSMRERFGGGANARAFDVGLAAAERQTEWGPGKQRLALSFDPGPRNAYMAAAEYTLDRNRNAARVAIGTQIVHSDPELAAAREQEPDARFGLGFDVATAIFGDPSLGAQGNTALGPGSLGVRAALSEPGKRGFDAAVKLHLSRQYAP